MPKVFIVEPTRVGAKVPAAGHGEVVTLWPKNAKRSSIWSEQFRPELLAALKREDYNPHEDYLVVAGNMVTLALTIAAITLEYDEINLLLYSAPAQDYVPRTIRKDITHES
jgi:hypothetical protein